MKDYERFQTWLRKEFPKHFITVYEGDYLLIRIVHPTKEVTRDVLINEGSDREILSHVRYVVKKCFPPVPRKTKNVKYGPR